MSYIHYVYLISFISWISGILKMIVFTMYFFSIRMSPPNVELGIARYWRNVLKAK